MTTYHIQGMGVLGSMLAHRMVERGINFTWEDNNAEFTAWKASTGLAYPDGERKSFAGIQSWLDYAERYGVEHAEVESVPYAFAHKRPPHGGDYNTEFIGALQVAEPRAAVVNVQQFVLGTRKAMEPMRRTSPDLRSTRIIARPNSVRTDGYLMGWSAPVTFESEVTEKVGRAAFYAKAHRYDTTYAYPVPGEPYWLAGSMYRMTRSPKASSPVELYEMYTGWEQNARALLGLENVELVGPIRQGWRPRGFKHLSPAPSYSGGTWHMPSLPSSGIRHGWLVVDELINTLDSEGVM